ncbi:MAG TPA: PQQ-dependent sugar dehydrogenase [Terriglobia bacterium]|nr:PQQ-dependent sugar dehydrogenase [Terriglobia bacterium]
MNRRLCILYVMTFAASAMSASGQTLEIRDYMTFPITGSASGAGILGELARINSFQEEPGGKRFFAHDLNGPLYIIDKSTRTPVVYLNLNGRGAQPGVFHRLSYEAGYANGFVSFQFDPDYETNGRFYTVHIEEPEVAASAIPDNRNTPGLNTAGYSVTPAIRTPGAIQREAVVVEWTDTNRSNSTFEGGARELMRVELNTRIHPMGDIVFNPSARRGDPDWRVMYIGCGDGGSGEQTSAMRSNPQRLDALVGKILRIIPDLNEHAATSAVSDNGRYRIPNDNPFVAVEHARREIWASGLRNPHRLTWHGDHLIAASIGLHTWESVYLIHKGANYGYSLREGTETLQRDNTTAGLPAEDRLPVMVSDTITAGAIVPTYPVVEYGHVPGGGDAISGGFVYRGSTLTFLRGMYVFGDITTGRVWYADFEEMLKADDGKAGTLATKHELKIRWNGASYATMFPIVEAAYHARGGKDADLPGSATVSGAGRADIRLAVDAAGELYIYSKSDGVIRAVTGVTAD